MFHCNVISPCSVMFYSCIVEAPTSTRQLDRATHPHRVCHAELAGLCLRVTPSIEQKTAQVGIRAPFAEEQARGVG